MGLLSTVEYLGVEPDELAAKEAEQARARLEFEAELESTEERLRIAAEEEKRSALDRQMIELTGSREEREAAAPDSMPPRPSDGAATSRVTFWEAAATR